MPRTRAKHPFEAALSRGIAAQRRRVGLSVADCVRAMQADPDVRKFYEKGFDYATWLRWESEKVEHASVTPFAMLPAVARVLKLRNVRELIPSRTIGSKRPNRRKAGEPAASDA